MYSDSIKMQCCTIHKWICLSLPISWTKPRAFATVRRLLAVEILGCHQQTLSDAAEKNPSLLNSLSRLCPPLCVTEYDASTWCCPSKVSWFLTSDWLNACACHAVPSRAHHLFGFVVIGTKDGVLNGITQGGRKRGVGGWCCPVGTYQIHWPFSFFVFFSLVGF